MAFELRRKIDVIKKMKTEQVKEAVAMLMIGDCVLGVLAPGRHVRLWKIGPPRLRKAVEGLADRLHLTRTILIFENAGAAIAGGLIGGLACRRHSGVLESKGEDYASTARDYEYRPTQGTLVRMEDVDADPARVGSRETVHLIARYALLPPNRNEELSVRERWEITHRARLVGTPVLTLSRTGGTWSSALPLSLPPNTEPGTYRASVEVQANGATDRGVATFTVR